MHFHNNLQAALHNSPCNDKEIAIEILPERQFSAIPRYVKMPFQKK
jgi:hypothetical protein